MNTRLAGCLLFVACALAATHTRAGTDASSNSDTTSAPRSGNVLKLRKAPSAAVDHMPTIESFVQLATTKDVDTVYKTFADVPVQANGELALKHYLATEVTPFFADAKRLDTHARVVGATFEDNSTGQIAYAYVVTASGRIKPFSVAWRVEQGRARLMDVKVDRCVKARHPVIPGGCEH